MIRALAAAALLALAACAQEPASVTDRFPARTAEEAAAEGRAFLEKNKTAEGVQVTASGLQYRVIKAGPAEGQRPSAASIVQVHYEGKLLDGTVFDSSYQSGQPAVFPVGQLIPAWVEALQLMRPGDVWEIWAPSELAYGPQGAGGAIPPNATLYFRMELLAVQG
jgi:FKBP-type peptidyl-prolyl cis-trans isomerase FklB